jgi:hypothetical protein
MADQGSLARVSAGVVPGTTGQRQAVTSSQTRSAVSVSGTAQQGVGRREVPNQGNRNLVNLDGKQLNRAAPRGTYLNILV